MTKDQTSLGSQPQYRPHASAAQMAPATTVKVHSTNATACSWNEVCSSARLLGTRARNRLDAPPAATTASCRCWTSWTTARLNPMVNSAEARMAMETWTTSQELCSAGDRALACVGNSWVASTSVSGTGSTTKVPSQRHCRPCRSRTR